MRENEILDSDAFKIIEEANEFDNYVELISNADTIVTLDLIKATLRQNDIHFIVKNEMMLQTEPFLANSADTAKILVHQENLEQAIQLLDATGYNIKESGELTNPINDFAHSIAQGIPFLRDLRSELQMVIVFGVAAILFAFFAYAVLFS